MQGTMLEMPGLIVASSMQPSLVMISEDLTALLAGSIVESSMLGQRRLYDFACESDDEEGGATPNMAACR